MDMASLAGEVCVRVEKLLYGGGVPRKIVQKAHSFPDFFNGGLLLLVPSPYIQRKPNQARW